jgi:hypothetical protein
MEILKFSKNKDFKTFRDDLKEEGFLIKEENDLFQIIFDPSFKKNRNILLENEYDSVIMEKNSLKIVCYMGNKIYNNYEKICLDENYLYVCHSFEGVMIHLYFYNNEWVYSTKNCIQSKNNSVQYLLFNECLNYYPIEQHLDKNLCYCFLIMHPSNNKVIIN